MLEERVTQRRHRSRSGDVFFRHRAGQGLMVFAQQTGQLHPRTDPKLPIYPAQVIVNGVAGYEELPAGLLVAETATYQFRDRPLRIR